MEAERNSLKSGYPQMLNSLFFPQSIAVIGTQLVATVFAVHGILMTPIGWGWGLAVWGYALAWFLVNDRIKLAAYRIFNLHEPGLLVKGR